MQFSKIQYYEKVESLQHREFIQAQNNCILCSSVLELRHIPPEDMNRQKPEVKEEAYCPHCDVRTRAKIYTLN